MGKDQTQGIIDAYLCYEIDAEEMVEKLTALRSAPAVGPANRNPWTTPPSVTRALQAIRRINRGY